MKASESPWESFARTDPEWFILTDLEAQQRPGESKHDAFFRTGRESVDEMLTVVEPHLGAQGTALEIGPGVGRLTLAMSAHFEHVRAVDTSATMLEQLREHARTRGCTNVETFLPHQGWDEGPRVDFAYSRLVFQHIQNPGAISEYIQRIAATLSPSGCAYLQFDTRKRGLDYQLRNALPDWVLPRSQRRGIRRIRRDCAWLDELIARAGMTAIEEHGRGSAHHAYVLRRA